MTPAVEAPRSFQSQLDTATCTYERLLILTDTIIEKQRVAMDETQHGKEREREFYNIWCLLMMLQDSMKLFDKDLEAIQAIAPKEGGAA